MKIKELKPEEIDAMSYDDLAYEILVENAKKMKINTLFDAVCKAKKMNPNEFEDKIADFFELLSTDKRFIMLDKGFWDLRDNHSNKIKVELDDEEDEVIEEVENDLPIEEDEDEESIFYDTDDTEDDDTEEDDIKDLAVINEEDMDGLS